ncbi:hypothetical protein [Kaarinaea lacus]
MAKKYGLTGILLVIAFFFSTSVFAGGLTFGAKTGPMRIDSAGIKDDPTNAGVTVGTEMGLVLGDIGVEGEFTTTMKDGKTKGTPSSNVDLDTMGLYATYRSPGFLYFKARTGFVHWESGSQDDTVTSMGLGLGFSLGIVQIELEYTEIDDDIDFISIGVVF